MDDAVDILGGPVSRRAPSLWQTVPSIARYAVYIAVLFGLYFAALKAWAFLKLRQEMNYRMSMRRKHGIPDDDRRPFNVAYSSLVRERQRPDWVRLVAETLTRPPGSGTVTALQPEAAQQAQHQASGVEVRNATSQAQPQTNNSLHPSRRAPTPMPRADATAHAPSDGPAQPANPNRRRTIRFVSPVVIRTQKRAYGSDGSETDDEEGASKKSRTEGDQSSDEDSDGNMGPPNGSSRKRGMEGDGRGPDGDKRRRQGVLAEGDDLDGDGDEVAEQESMPRTRGRKRDRAEAASTVGAEDEEIDQNTLKRKRPTIAKKKSDGSTGNAIRGQKRDRDSESVESDEGRGDDIRWERTKRKGKKTRPSTSPWDDRSDLSDDDSPFVEDSFRGKRIGETWDVNGVSYKLGADGRRLRQALVKKARSRFTMPKDSQHPDRSANQDVFVECWLTEKEYRGARERHELAWQDTPSPSHDSSLEPETLDEPETPTRSKAKSQFVFPLLASGPGTGKNLLWSSTTSPSASPQRHSMGPSGRSQSLTSSSGTAALTSSATMRRLASSFLPSMSMGIPADSDSPKKEAFRSFSKWERQDLEAEAMKKMRAKLEEEKKSKSKSEISMMPPPRIGEGFGKAPAAPTFSLGAPQPAPAKPAQAAAQPTPTFSLTPPTAISQSASAPAATNAFAPPPASNPPNASFSFSKPPAQQSAPRQPPSQSTQPPIPNFFAVPSGPATPAAPAPAPPPPAPTAAPTSTQSSNPPATQPPAGGFSWSAPIDKPSSFAVASGTAPSGAAPSFSFTAAAKPTPAPLSEAADASKPSIFGSAAAATAPPFGRSQPSTSQNLQSAPTVFGTQAQGGTAGTTAPSSSAFGAPSTARPSIFGEPKMGQEGQGQGQSGGSLLNRLGPFASPPPKAPTTAATSTPPSTFSFKPTMSTTPLGPPPSTTLNASTTPLGPPPPPQTVPGPTVPKFTFGMTGAKSDAPNGAPSMATAPSSNPFTFGDKTNDTMPVFGTKPSTNAGSSDAAPAMPAPSKFSFGEPSTFGTKTNSAAPAGGSTASKFTFGPGFGNTQSTTTTSTSGGFAAFSSGKPSVFGATAGTTTPAGSPATSNVFGNASGSTPAFGGAGSTGGDGQPSKPGVFTFKPPAAPAASFGTAANSMSNPTSMSIFGASGTNPQAGTAAPWATPWKPMFGTDGNK